MTAHQSAAQGAKTGQGDIRVTAGRGNLALKPVPSSPVCAFAEAIRQRYRSHLVRWSGVGLVYCQQQRGVVLQPIHHRSLLHLAPRLTLTLPPPAAMQARSRVIERITTVRHERVELAGEAAPSTGGHPVPRPAHDGWEAAPPRPPELLAPPVPHVVRRSAQPAPLSEAAPIAEGAASGRLGRETSPASAGHRPASTGPVDVARLADEVIKTIDRRIIAQRERMGRL